MQLHRDYIAMQQGGGGGTATEPCALTPPLQPYSATPPQGGSAVKPERGTAMKQCYEERPLRSGSGYGDQSVSGGSALSRDSVYSGQFTYAVSPQASGQPSGEAGAPSCGGGGGGMTAAVAASQPAPQPIPQQPRQMSGAGAVLSSRRFVETQSLLMIGSQATV